MPLLLGDFLLPKFTSLPPQVEKSLSTPSSSYQYRSFLLFTPISSYSPYLTHRSNNIHISIFVPHPSLTYRQLLRLYSLFYILLHGYLQSYIINIQNLISISVFIKRSFVLGIYGGIILMFGSIMSILKETVAHVWKATGSTSC